MPTPPDAGPIHRRQFIIDTDRHREAEGWMAERLGNGLWLSHCPRLRVRRLPDGQGGTALLLGTPLLADPDQDDFQLSPARAAQDLADAAYAWSGRWTLVTGDWLLADSTNLASIFYQPGPGGRTLVSTSLALIHGLRPELPVLKRRIGWYGMNWFPPPHSRIVGVRKLLPDQALRLSDGTVHRVSRWNPERFAGKPVGALAEMLLRSLGQCFKSAASVQDRLALALTAGLDSRTLLAAALEVGVRVDTMIQLFPLMPLADKVLPPEIARHCGLRWDAVPRGAFNLSRQRRFDAHTFRNMGDADRSFYARGMYDWMGPGTALVRGGGFEVGRERMEDRLRGLGWEEALADPDGLLESYGDFGSRPWLRTQMRDWLRWAVDGPRPYGLGNQFYRDQRLAGWLSAAEQSSDMLEGCALQVVNCGYHHDLMLAAPLEDRRTGTVQRQAIALAGRGLAEFPVNPPMETRMQRRLQRWSLKGRRTAGELRNMAMGLLDGPAVGVTPVRTAATATSPPRAAEGR
ncbi:hypothetical protein HHL28_10020 [Aerophototrophica crusticola]|uniref:Asparagine synthetase domain-containing protein n=1 Tax=Aerophototrophica crusticola TaxID=1709002 RepID=A0A858R7N7_9PROT|nr:hypothetical protein HHL28_10020 [Rhodospirillaceae bacterium B3]